MGWGQGTLGGIDRKPIVDQKVHLVHSTEEWKGSKRTTGEIYRDLQEIKTIKSLPHPDSHLSVSRGCGHLMMTKKMPRAKTRAAAQPLSSATTRFPWDTNSAPAGRRCYLDVFIPSITATGKGCDDTATHG